MELHNQEAPRHGSYGMVELSKLRASPNNRKRFNEQALQELAASITTMGVAQAILIRPVTPTEDHPEPFEIVAGERRFRASKLAGKTEIPALCRELSDLDAAKIRILENLQREDPHPMEEAEGYQLLMLQHGFTADQLVDEVKKSRAYIYGRLKLCALTPEVREMFLDDKLSASTALLVARIPVPSLQVKAAQEILTPDWQGNTMSHRAAASHIQNRYMLKLGAAVFSLSDAKLLASAGSCVKCPKRAGNQPEVFEGVDPNVCTDPDCFAEKRAAHHNAIITTANKKGIPVYEWSEATALFGNNWSPDAKFVSADVHLTRFERNAPSTKNSGYVKEHLTADTLPPAAVYAKKSDGEVVAFFLRTEIQAALEEVGACETIEQHRARMQALAENPDEAPEKTAAQLKREKEAEEHAMARALKEKGSAFRLSLYKQLRQRASVAGLSLLSLREYVRAVHDDRGLDSDVHSLYEFDVRTDLDEFINHADANALQLLLLDLMLGDRLDATWWHGDEDDDEFAPIMAMARHEGIDVDAVRAEIFMPSGADQPEGIEPIPDTGTESTPGVIETSAAEDALAHDQVGRQATTTTDQVNQPAAVVTVRYRNPNHPAQAWTGRGKQPKWVSEWLESGKSLDSLRVPAQAAEQEGSDQQQTNTEPTDPVDEPASTAATQEPTGQIDSTAPGVETPAADDNQGDGELLSEQMVEATQAEANKAVQTSARAKKAKAKPTHAGKATK